MSGEDPRGGPPSRADPSVPLEYVQPLNEMVTELKLLEGELASARSENTQLAQRVRSLEWELTSAKSGAAALSEENNRLQDKITQLVQSAEEAAMQANRASFDAKQEIQALSSQNKILEQHLNSLSRPATGSLGGSAAGSAAAASESMLKQLETMREQTRQEYESILKNMQLEFDATVGSLRAAKSGLESEATHLSSLLNEARSQLEQARREIGALRSQVDNAGLQAGAAASASNEIASLRAQLQAAHAQIAATGGAGHVAVSGYPMAAGPPMGAPSAFSQQEMAMMRDEVASLQNQNARLKDALRSKNDTVNEMVAELSAMKDAMVGTESRIMTALGSAPVGSAAAQHGSDADPGTHAQVVALERGRAHMNEALAQARSDAHAAADEVARLKAKLASMTRRAEDEENARLDVEREASAKERNLAAEKSSLKLRVSALTDDLAELKDRHASVVRDLRRKLRDAESADDSEAHEEAMAEMQAKYAAERRALHMATLAREDLERDLTSKTTQWNAERASLRERNESMAEELEEVRMNFTLAQREIQRLHDVRDKAMGLEERVHALEQSNTKLTRQLAAEHDAREALDRELAKANKAALANATHHREELADARQSAAKANEAAELAAADAARKVKAIRVEMDALEDALRKADGGVALANRNALLESQIQKADATVEHLEERLRDATVNGNPDMAIELAVAKRDLENANAHLDDVRAERESARSKANAAAATITELQLELAALRRDCNAAAEKAAQAQMMVSTHKAEADAAKSLLDRERDKFERRVREMEVRDKERERERVEMERMRDIERERQEAEREKERERLRERERADAERERAERERERQRQVERERERERREADREARRIEEERARVRDMERLDAERERERIERERQRAREHDETIAAIRAESSKAIRKADEAKTAAETKAARAAAQAETMTEQYHATKEKVEELTGMISELRARLDDALSASADDAVKLEDNAVELAELRAKVAELETAVGAADGVLSSGTLVDNDVLAGLERDASRVAALEPKVDQLHAELLAKAEATALATARAAADQASLRSARDRVRSLEQELDELRNAVSAAQEEVAAHASAAAETQDKAQAALAARDDLVQAKTDLEWQLSGAREDAARLEAELAELRETHARLVDQVEAQAAETAVAELVDEQRALAAENAARLQDNIDQLNAELEATRAQGQESAVIAALKAELAAKSARLEELETQVAEAPIRELMSQTLATVQNGAREQISAAVHELRETFNAEADARWQSVCHDVDLLRSQLDESVVQQEVVEGAALERLLDETAAAKAETTALLQQATQDMEATLNDKMGSFISGLEAQHIAEAEAAAAQARHEQMEALLRERDAAASSAATYKGQARELAASLEAVIAKLEAKSTAASEARVELARTRADAQARIDALTQANAKLEARVAELAESVQVLEQSAARSQSEAAAARTALDSARSSAESSVHAAVEAQTTVFEAAKAELEAKVAELAQHAAELEGQLKEARAQATVAAIDLNESVGVTRELEHALVAGQNTAVVDRKRVEDAEARAAAAHAQAEEARRFAQACQDDNERLLAQLESTLAQLQVAQTAASTRRLVSEHQPMVGSRGGAGGIAHEYKAQVDELHRLIKTLEQELALADQAKSKLESQLHRAEIEAEAARADAEQQRTRADRLYAANMGLEQKLVHAAKLQRKVDVLTSERDREDGTIARLRSTLKEQEKTIAELKERVRIGRAAIMAGGAAGGSVSSKVDVHYEARLAALEEENRVLRSRNVNSGVDGPSNPNGTSFFGDISSY